MQELPLVSRKILPSPVEMMRLRCHSGNYSHIFLLLTIPGCNEAENHVIKNEEGSAPNMHLLNSWTMKKIQFFFHFIPFHWHTHLHGHTVEGGNNSFCSTECKIYRVSFDSILKSSSRQRCTVDIRLISKLPRLWYTLSLYTCIFNVIVYCTLYIRISLYFNTQHQSWTELNCGNNRKHFIRSFQQDYNIRKTCTSKIKGYLWVCSIQFECVRSVQNIESEELCEPYCIFEQICDHTATSWSQWLPKLIFLP